MSGSDLSLPLRRAIVLHLSDDDTISAIVGERVYAEQSPANPSWPFVRYGFPTIEPFEATLWSGSEQDITIHAFAKGPGTDNVSILAKAIVEALNDDDIIADYYLLLEGDMQSGNDHLAFEGDEGDGGALLIEDTALSFNLAALDWLDTQIVRDTDEAGAYHAVIRFNVKTFETVSI